MVYILNFSMEITRRELLTLGAMSLGGMYTMGQFFNFLGPEGWDGLQQYWDSEKNGLKEKDSDFYLVDNHAHFGFPTEEEFPSLLSTFFDKGVDFQAITRRSVHSDIYSYTWFVLDLKNFVEENKDYRIDFSDSYATVVYRGDERVVFTRSQEVETFCPESVGGLFYNDFSVHLVVEGHPKIQNEDMSPFQVLDLIENKAVNVTVAHPFTTTTHTKKGLLGPIARKATFWYASKGDQETNLDRIAKNYNVMFETNNFMSTLHMSAANGMAQAFAESRNLVQTGATDVHPSTDYSLIKQIIGSSGTQIPKSSLENLSSYTGREILEARTLATKSPEAKVLRNQCTLGLFYDAIIKLRFGL